MENSIPHLSDTEGADITHPEAGLTRRGLLIGILAASTASLLLLDGCASDGSDGITLDEKSLLIDGIDLDNPEELKSYIESLKEAAELLNKNDNMILANNLLASESVKFDDNYPRIRESFIWASKEGVFPLVNPVGDIDDGLESVSPNVPAQKPLLVLLNLMAASGIQYTITSVATSSEHGYGSHHYQGRGVDLRTPEAEPDTVQMMRFVKLLHNEGIVTIDESFAPGNIGGSNLDRGEPSTTQEGSHIHLSTAPVAELHEINTSYPKLFRNKKASEIAGNLGINAGTYFNMTREQGETLSEKGGFGADGADKVLRELYPAEVVDKEAMIEAAANEAGIPANLLAAIATIESAGMQDALSSADAHGIVQVVPRFHRDRIDTMTDEEFEAGKAGDAARSEYLRDNPQDTLRIGADFLKELLDNARDSHPDLDPNHPAIYARVAAAYNGGPANIQKGFSEWKMESKLYANFISAFYVDVSLAAGLREAGLDSSERLAAMQSPDVWARSVALRTLNAVGSSNYQDYSDAYRALETRLPGVSEAKDDYLIDNMAARTAYNLALAGYEFDSPMLDAGFKHMPPALTYWVAHGGYGLIKKPEANQVWLSDLEDRFGR